ncbi:MAG: histone deacetylase [Anaerolineae bacterium]|nr:histone deacetylase [Anaerolineae bacterium]
MTTLYVTHPRFPEHDSPGHPEHAGRIRAIWQRLDETGLAARMQAVEAPSIERDLILSVHTPRYLDLLDKLSGLDRTVRLDNDTYANPWSYEIARLSAGGVVRAVEAVASGAVHNALAAVRPPGHHAMPDHGMGFCLLGNIALAARYAQQHSGLRRILIVDYDVHHGNGTEAMFYNDPSVLFISTHQQGIYPGTGAISDTGVGKGVGYTINVPLIGGHGDASYAAIFEQIVWPAAIRFEPELILVSAGFDAHWDDPLAGIHLSLNGYAHLTRELVRMANQLCGGKIAFIVEGGYNLDVLSEGVANIARVLLGEATVDPLGASPYSERTGVDNVIARVKQVQGL